MANFTPWSECQTCGSGCKQSIYYIQLCIWRDQCSQVLSLSNNIYIQWHLSSEGPSEHYHPRNLCIRPRTKEALLVRKVLQGIRKRRSIRGRPILPHLMICPSQSPSATHQHLTGVWEHTETWEDMNYYKWIQKGKLWNMSQLYSFWDGGQHHLYIHTVHSQYHNKYTYTVVQTSLPSISRTMSSS